MLDCNPLAVFVLDDAARLRYGNRRACALLDREELPIGRFVWEVLPDTPDADLRQACWRTMQNGVAEACSHPDPRGGLLDSDIAPFGRGVILHCRNSAADQTVGLGFHASAHQLQARLAELDLIYRSAPIGLAVLGPDLRFRYVNERLAAMNGIAPADHIGKSVGDLLPQYRDITEEIGNRVLRSGEAVRNLEIAGETPAEPGVHRQWLEHWLPLTDDAGQVLGINIVVEEVTERNRIAQRLHDNAEELQALLDAVPAIVFLAHDPGCEHVEGNHACEAFLGLPPGGNAAAFAGAEASPHFHVLIGGVEAATEQLPLRRAAAAGQEVRDCELGIAFGDGRLKHIFGHTRPLFDQSGKPRGAVGAFLDITELVEARRTARHNREELERLVAERTQALMEANAALLQQITEREQAEQALRQAEKQAAIGLLASGIAHDFNNVLAAIVGSLDLLERRVTAPEAARHFRTMRRAADRAEALTRRLLGFSREQQFAPAQLDANQIVMGMSELLRRTLGGSIVIQPKLQSGLWPVRADPNQLELALLNLGINARDAMPQGGVLHMETANTAALPDSLPDGLGPGDYVCIAVRDGGTGMPDSVLNRVMEPFFTTKPSGKGTGLGLSMVRGFARQAGGEIRISSEEGVGTVVELFLPRALAGIPGETGAD